MIITKTPYRISFFGGGSDYYTWYENFGGKVLSTSIKYYCYISCREYPPFHGHHSKVSWSKVELIDKHNSEIQHPAVKGVLSYLDITSGVEISHQGDLPARSGLGSSSSFTVGMLNAAYALKGQNRSRFELAQEAIYVEQNILQEKVGIQDQIATALGGFNKININRQGEFLVEPVILPLYKLEELKSHLMLFYTGITRTASNIAEDKMQRLCSKEQEIKTMMGMVDESLSILHGNSDINEFGKLLHESWQLKRSLSDKITNDTIDQIYQTALQNGATGGKLLGAGGGGFLLVFAKPECHQKILSALKHLIYIPFDYDNYGSTIIYYNQDGYSSRFWANNSHKLAS
ncbi:GHMP family kinase ATP-binding protein [Rickettsiales endosymbiont of Stachyamoeba lipophora]|uniref:GHMP family kinase ATP-binding protein n=1 Tax=Rickettsiales endosymbiont of Stachyamoeba lipophora TaxID=2486578 RepID=UPI000F64D4CB|nr:kinase [Rickettsiales endosymbiont of Stachyamoeba lipophora]AZL15675.1 kinase [Rickettsiales endosymbiont of Stachyamoeba lipophora]